ncbi:hypothetical protein H2248_003487 [Termitomyces sp. 'cryptogamus']|nr:hypothetical protein H2248_003487 [Termitomyces sp. 'cryptogamus']
MELQDKEMEAEEIKTDRSITAPAKDGRLVEELHSVLPAKVVQQMRDPDADAGDYGKSSGFNQSEQERLQRMFSLNNLGQQLYLAQKCKENTNKQKESEQLSACRDKQLNGEVPAILGAWGVK